MPYITVKALPLEDPQRVPDILQAVSRRFAEAAGIEELHITVTWETFAPGHYVKGGKVADVHDFETHPLVAELFVPDGNDEETVQFMLHTLARLLNEETGCPLHRMFITCRLAKSGYVYDDGEIAEW